MAPASGMLSTPERHLVLEALGCGMNVVNGLHEFLNDDLEGIVRQTLRLPNIALKGIRRSSPSGGRTSMRLDWTHLLASKSLARVATI